MLPAGPTGASVCLSIASPSGEYAQGGVFLGPATHDLIIDGVTLVDGDGVEVLEAFVAPPPLKTAWTGVQNWPPEGDNLARAERIPGARVPATGEDNRELVLHTRTSKLPAGYRAVEIRFHVGETSYVTRTDYAVQYGGCDSSAGPTASTPPATPSASQLGERA